MKDSMVVELTLEELIRMAGRYLQLKGVVADKYGIVIWANRISSGVGAGIPVLLQFYGAEDDKLLPTIEAGDKKKVADVERKLNIG